MTKATNGTCLNHECNKKASGTSKFCGAVCKALVEKMVRDEILKRHCAFAGCGVSFVASSIRQIYCGRACAVNSARDNWLNNPARSRSCAHPHCDSMFQPKRYDQIYCGRRCSNSINGYKKHGTEPTVDPISTPIPDRPVIPCASCSRAVQDRDCASGYRCTIEAAMRCKPWGRATLHHQEAPARIC